MVSSSRRPLPLTSVPHPPLVLPAPLLFLLSFPPHSFLQGGPAPAPTWVLLVLLVLFIAGPITFHSSQTDSCSPYATACQVLYMACLSTPVPLRHSPAPSYCIHPNLIRNIVVLPAQPHLTTSPSNPIYQILHTSLPGKGRQKGFSSCPLP